MDYIIDCLYDFAITLTYHIHDWGTIGNRKMFVEEYCNNQKIVEKECINAINKYSKYHIKNGLSWFPTKEEIKIWYSFYKYKKEQK